MQAQSEGQQKEQPTVVSETEELAVITAYLLNGGTLAKAKKFTAGAMESVYSMSYNLYKSGHYEKAARGFQYLCFYDHWNARNFLCLGACQQMMRLFDDALRTYDYTARIDRTNPLAKAYMGDCYRALGDDYRASIMYESAIEDAIENKFKHPEIIRINKLLKTLKNDEGEQ